MHVQVVHGGSNDVLWLQRDFHIFLVNVLDTEALAGALGPAAPRALAALLARYCGVQQVSLTRQVHVFISLYDLVCVRVAAFPVCMDGAARVGRFTTATAPGRQRASVRAFVGGLPAQQQFVPALPDLT